MLRETYDTETTSLAWELLDQTGTDKKQLTLSTLPPLSKAVILGDRAEVDRLLRQSAELAARSLNGNSALHWAVEAGNCEMAQLLLDAGANVNAFAVGGMTPLHRASAMGNRTLVDLLLDRGADVNIVSIGGYSPLHHAAAHGHVNVIRTLIARGASLAAKTDFRAQQKYMSPRELAVARGHLAALAALLGIKEEDARQEAAGILASMEKDTERVLARAAQLTRAAWPLAPRWDRFRDFKFLYSGYIDDAGRELGIDMARAHVTLDEKSQELFAKFESGDL